MTYAPHAQDVPATAGLVESIARLIAELAEVRVISDRRADRIAELERENGRLSERLDLAAPADSPGAGHQTAGVPAPTTGDALVLPPSRWRILASWVPLLVMLALATVTLLLTLVVLALT